MFASLANRSLIFSLFLFCFWSTDIPDCVFTFVSVKTLDIFEETCEHFPVLFVGFASPEVDRTESKCQVAGTHIAQDFVLLIQLVSASK